MGFLGVEPSLLRCHHWLSPSRGTTCLSWTDYILGTPGKPCSTQALEWPYRHKNLLSCFTLPQCFVFIIPEQTKQNSYLSNSITPGTKSVLFIQEVFHPVDCLAIPICFSDTKTQRLPFLPGMNSLKTSWNLPAVSPHSRMHAPLSSSCPHPSLAHWTHPAQLFLPLLPPHFQPLNYCAHIWLSIS